MTQHHLLAAVNSLQLKLFLFSARHREGAAIGFLIINLPREEHMAKTLCKTFGVVLLLVGFAGFAKSDLLGLHLTGMHNVVHIFTAGIALYIGFAETASAARTLCLVFGAIYLLLGVLGFVAPGVVAAIIDVGHDAGLSRQHRASPAWRDLSDRWAAAGAEDCDGLAQKKK